MALPQVQLREEASPTAGPVREAPNGDRSGLRSHVLDAIANLGLLVALWLAYALVRRVTGDAWDTARIHSTEILRLQSALGLPHEGGLQTLLLDRPAVIRAMNGYYMWAHFPVTGAFVVWAWARHSAAFSVIRITLIAVTGAGLILHLAYPLAPPRMMPGFIDTGATFGPSPYDVSASEAANQLAAMPSLHVGWALIVALSVIALSRHRWRWVALVHPVITTAVVVLTANHFWIDGIVAIVLVLGAWSFAARRERRRMLDLHLVDAPVRAAPDHIDLRIEAQSAHTGSSASSDLDAHGQLVSRP